MLLSGNKADRGGDDRLYAHYNQSDKSKQLIFLVKAGNVTVSRGAGQNTQLKDKPATCTS